eukprot:1428885-Ditylum_brightwellii.AAC.1
MEEEEEEEQEENETAPVVQEKLENSNADIYADVTEHTHNLTAITPTAVKNENEKQLSNLMVNVSVEENQTPHLISEGDETKLELFADSDVNAT